MTQTSSLLNDSGLRLRPWSMEDVDYAEAWYSDIEVLRNSEGTEKPYSREKIEEMYRYLSARGELYIIEVEESGSWKPIGDACLMPDSLPIVIGEPNYRSKGYGKRALALLISRARSKGWKELRVKGVYSNNENSIKLFLSLGFFQTGKILNKNGVTEYSYSLNL